MKFCFIAGLPRSGSTLLCNILNQNPRFYASGTSGVPEVMRGIRDGWNQVDAFRAMPASASQAAVRRVLSAILPAYYLDMSSPVVFDKSRAWPAYIEMLEHVLGNPVRVLACVRDVRDVLASLEKAHRRTMAVSITSQQRVNPAEFQTMEGRCKVWAAGDGIVGSAYNVLRDAVMRGHRDKIHFVRYEELTETPSVVLDGIHEFLGEESFIYDFENVRQVTCEDDRVHGFYNLHEIGSQVRPQPARWPFVLGEAISEQYRGQEFW